MSLEFVIIPVSKLFNDSALELQEKLHSELNGRVSIKIDEEFGSLMNTRINDWQDKGYDIITIGPSYIEDNRIAVRFNDNGSKPENMLVDDFIELVNSFDIEEDENIKDDEEDSGCVIV